MPTRRFSDLSPTEQLDVIEDFLGSSEKVDFTEKLAGQHLTLVLHPGGSVEYVGKSGGKSKVGLFPAVNKVLRNHHPPVSNDVRYEFEVLKRSERPDFIDYPIEKELVVVELTGKMSKSTVDVLNSSQDVVGFMSRDSIKKSTMGLVTDPDIAEELNLYRDMLSSGARPPKEEAKRIETILMGLIDSGRVPSSLGSAAIEGLFGTVPSGGFKIPSASYAEVQRDQAKFFAAYRKMPWETIAARFAAASGDPTKDRLVSDVIEYIEKMSAKVTPRGFRTYFSKQELSSLTQLILAYESGNPDSGVELAKRFFERVGDKSAWVTTESKRFGVFHRFLLKKNI